MRRFRGFSLLAAVAALALVIVPMTSALADGGSRRLSADPWIFVGTAAQCGGPAGSRIVTSAWLGGMGLPDNGGANSPNPSTRNDPHLGLLLNKNGPTADCSSSGATIKGAKGIVTDAAFELGYDYRVGGHCGAGAPRFNLETSAGSFFVGCANSVQTPAPQDAQWMRSRSVLATCGSECFPGPIPAGTTINSIDIVFDEGTDTVSVSDPTGVGLAVIDNIDIGGKIITSGSGIEPGGGGRDNDDHGGHGGHHDGGGRDD
jgi:hypothetical protein